MLNQELTSGYTKGLRVYTAEREHLEVFRLRWAGGAAKAGSRLQKTEDRRQKKPCSRGSRDHPQAKGEGKRVADIHGSPCPPSWARWLQAQSPWSCWVSLVADSLLTVLCIFAAGVGLPGVYPGGVLPGTGEDQNGGAWDLGQWGRGLLAWHA